jgi:predicted RNA binding protein YcfA (HicA-like mRNA interferase family)
VPKPIIYKKLLDLLHPFGIIVIANRGKGSHRMLYQEETKSNFPVKYHGKNKPYGKGLLRAIIRKFKLPDDIFN